MITIDLNLSLIKQAKSLLKDKNINDTISLLNFYKYLYFDRAKTINLIIKILSMSLSKSDKYIVKIKTFNNYIYEKFVFEKLINMKIDGKIIDIYKDNRYNSVIECKISCSDEKRIKNIIDKIFNELKTYKYSIFYIYSFYTIRYLFDINKNTIFKIKKRTKFYELKNEDEKTKNRILNNKVKTFKIFESYAIPDVSIIIPVYNNEKYISACLTSICKQSLKNIEIICIDDGSTDLSAKIIKEYADKDKRIKIFAQENLGAGVARNKGLNYASGKYISFLDSDDYFYDINSLNILYSICEKEKFNICGGEILIDKGGEITLHSDKKLNLPEKGIIKYKDYQFDYGYTRFIYNRKFIEENCIQFPSYRRFQDPPFFVKAMIAAQHFYFTSLKFYCWRINHKKLEFTEKKAADFINGLTENLLISKYYNLPKLHKLCVNRINYKEYLASIKQFRNNNLIKNKLKFFNDNIDIQMLKKEGMDVPDNYTINLLTY